MSPYLSATWARVSEIDETAFFSQDPEPPRNSDQLRIEVGRQRLRLKVTLQRNSECGAVMVFGVCPGSTQTSAFAKHEFTITHAESDHIIGNVQAQIRPQLL